LKTGLLKSNAIGDGSRQLLTDGGTQLGKRETVVQPRIVVLDHDANNGSGVGVGIDMSELLEDEFGVVELHRMSIEQAEVSRKGKNTKQNQKPDNDRRVLRNKMFSRRSKINAEERRLPKTHILSVMSKSEMHQPKKKGGGSKTPRIQNKRAFHDYHVMDKLEAGIELVGSEVKSVRQGKV